MTQLSNYIYIKYLDGLCFKDGALTVSKNHVVDYQNRGSKKTKVKLYTQSQGLRFLTLWKKNLQWRHCKTDKFYKEKRARIEKALDETSEKIEAAKYRIALHTVVKNRYEKKGLDALHKIVRTGMYLKAKFLLKWVLLKERKIYLMNSIKESFPQWAKDLAKVGIIALYILTACIALFVEWVVNKSINAIRLHRIRSPKDVETIVSMRKHLVFPPGKEDLEDKFDGILYDYNELKTSF